VCLLVLFCMPFLIVSAEQPAIHGTDVGLKFDRVLIVVLENQPLTSALRNSVTRNVISKGTLLANYYALVNPSQPNYIGLLAGDLMGVSKDAPYDIAGENLVDLMESKNVSWKSYQEDYPGNCFTGETASHGLYKRKHNPFISFDNIRNNPNRCAKIVNANELQQDLADGTLPQFSFYTPNMDNNGHDTSLTHAAKWLTNTFLPKYLEPFNSTGNALLVITFDEGVRGDNQIYTLLIGDMVPEGHYDMTRYDHYSLLRLIQDNYNLGSLHRRDEGAKMITKENFVEGTPEYDDGRVMKILAITLPCVGVALLAAGLAVYFYKKRNRNVVLEYTLL